MTDDQVEKVARAIEDALDAGDYASGVWLGRPGKTTDLALFNAARAAIAAMDDGWREGLNERRRNSRRVGSGRPVG